LYDLIIIIIHHYHLPDRSVAVVVVKRE